MKRTSFMKFRRWLLTGTLALGLSTIAAVNTPGFAQVIPGEPDHLKCYEVLQDQNPPGENEVDLVNKFGLEPNCHVANKARLFCTPVSEVHRRRQWQRPTGPGVRNRLHLLPSRVP